MDVDGARSLMREWTRSDVLRLHMESVAACMAAYAERLESGEKQRWIVAGLLHDMDYERLVTRWRPRDRAIETA